jgi:hypothetical protein
MQRSAPDSGCDEKAEASASRLSTYNWPGTAFLVSHWPIAGIACYWSLSLVPAFLLEDVTYSFTMFHGICDTF